MAKYFSHNATLQIRSCKVLQVLIAKNKTFVRLMSLRYSTELDTNGDYPTYGYLVTLGA